MDHLTESEALFEKFCAQQGIACRRIRTARKPNKRRPDYWVKVGDKAIVVEVKQIDENEADRDWREQLEQNGHAFSRAMPGQRVERLIAAGYGQLSSFTKRGIPGLLVVYDATPYPRHIHSLGLIAAMFGRLSIVVEVGARRSGNVWNQPRGGMTKDQRTSVSAVGVLEHVRPDRVLLNLYHNHNARVPLDRKCIATIRLRQWSLDRPQGAFGRWTDADPVLVRRALRALGAEWEALRALVNRWRIRRWLRKAKRRPSETSASPPGTL